MKNIGGLIAYAMSQYGTEPGKVKELNVTENGTYTAPSGYMGFNPINTNVDVTPKIQELAVSEPGTYYAKTYGCDGFDPVIVSDKYKKLYEQAKGEGESIDTGITDEDGNDVVLDNAISIDYGDIDDYLRTILSEKDTATVATVIDNKYVIKYDMGFVFTVKNNKEFVDPLFTITNLKSGESTTYLQPSSYPWTGKLKKNGYEFSGFNPVLADGHTTSFSFRLNTLTNSSGWLASLSYKNIGITEGLARKQVDVYIV